MHLSQLVCWCLFLDDAVSPNLIFGWDYCLRVIQKTDNRRIHLNEKQFLAVSIMYGVARTT